MTPSPNKNGHNRAYGAGLATLRFARPCRRRYASMGSIAAAILLLYVGSTLAEESPAERVSAYLVAFNSGLNMEEVGAEYWFTEMMLNTGERPPIHLSGSALAQRFERLRLGLEEAGWIRSEMGEIRNCQFREDFAIVGVAYTRVFENGTRRPGAALYTLGKDSSVWKISSINLIDDVRKLECSEKDA